MYYFSSLVHWSLSTKRVSCDALLLNKRYFQSRHSQSINEHVFSALAMKLSYFLKNMLWMTKHFLTMYQVVECKSSESEKYSRGWGGGRGVDEELGRSVVVASPLLLAIPQWRITWTLYYLFSWFDSTIYKNTYKFVILWKLLSHYIYLNKSTKSGSVHNLFKITPYLINLDSNPEINVYSFGCLIFVLLNFKKTANNDKSIDMTIIKPSKQNIA